MTISIHKPAHLRRLARVRAAVKKTGRLRLSVFRANKHLSAQIIDDSKGITLVGLTTSTIKEKLTKTEKAKLLGQKIAQAAQDHKITQVVFDRGANRYQGRIKAFAEAAREAGLKL